MADYRQADLDEARKLVPDAHPKAQERVARALAARERKHASRAARGLPPATDDDQREVTVCDACLQASCWQTVFMCNDARSAGTKRMTVAELRALGREHESYWRSDEEVARG